MDIHLGELLSKWHQLPDEKKAKYNDDLQKYLKERLEITAEARTIQQKQMAFDKAFWGWINTWADDKNDSPLIT